MTLTTQPFKTLKFFVLAIHDYIKQCVAYLLAKGGWFLVLTTLVMSSGVLLATIEGSHEKVPSLTVDSISFALFICNW